MVPYAIRWPLASSIHWSFRLLCLLGILPTIPTVSLFLSMMSIILLFTLIAELKGQAKRLEEDVRSLRNCIHIYSLLAGMAAVT